jgi:hypothetical protein
MKISRTQLRKIIMNEMRQHLFEQNNSRQSRAERAYTDIAQEYLDFFMRSDEPKPGPGYQELNAILDQPRFNDSFVRSVKMFDDAVSGDTLVTRYLIGQLEEIADMFGEKEKDYKAQRIALKQNPSSDILISGRDYKTYKMLEKMFDAMSKGEKAAGIAQQIRDYAKK